jgi:ATP-dependent DNA ligase
MSQVHSVTHVPVHSQVLSPRRDSDRKSGDVDRDAGRWGQGLTAEKMKECVWVRPEIVAEIQFLEWTGADHLRHTKFVRLREDKDPSTVIKET